MASKTKKPSFPKLTQGQFDMLQALLAERQKITDAGQANLNNIAVAYKMIDESYGVDLTNNNTEIHMDLTLRPIEKKED